RPITPTAASRPITGLAASTCAKGTCTKPSLCLSAAWNSREGCDSSQHAWPVGGRRNIKENLPSMRYSLWEMRPYFRQVAGQLVLGSIMGIIMNTAVVLPAILLGQAIDAALAFERGDVGPGAVGWAAMAFVGGTLLTEVPRATKRWWLMTANARIRANIRADAWRGVIAWPMGLLGRTPAGDVMARIIGDVDVLSVGVREFSIETWDTLLFSLSLMVAMLVYDPTLTVLALLPVPIAMLLAKATGRW